MKPGCTGAAFTGLCFPAVLGGYFGYAWLIWVPDPFGSFTHPGDLCLLFSFVLFTYLLILVLGLDPHLMQALPLSYTPGPTVPFEQS
jgi:hypothetical protein